MLKTTWMIRTGVVHGC